MSFNKTFLEKEPQARDDDIDELEQLVKTKIDLKTGFAEPAGCARAMLNALRCLDLSDDETFTKASFHLVMRKLNCGHDQVLVDGLFFRYDTEGTGRFSLKHFADGLFGVVRIPRSSPECRDVLFSLGQRLRCNGDNAYRQFHTALRTATAKGKRFLTSEMVQECLTRCGCDPPLDIADLKTLEHFLSVDSRGNMDVSKLMVALRTPMSESRVALARLAYLRLERNPDGKVTFEDLLRLYRSERTPLALKGAKTPEEVHQEFAESWLKLPQDEVTEKEFVDYYKDISSTIDNDAYFEMTVRNAWHQPGSGSPSPQRGCRTMQLTVTHLDGTRSMETIDPDLGLHGKGDEALINNLRKQGVTDILKVSKA